MGLIEVGIRRNIRQWQGQQSRNHREKPVTSCALRNKRKPSPMRVIADIPHPACKITLFYWNSKYLIKLERSMVEQTYKVSELDLTGEEEARKLLDEVFISEIVARFVDMEASLGNALGRL
jgi:hypothetical protein